MNPSLCTQPEQLFGARIHAGGWPKLGWEQQDENDDAWTTRDDDEERPAA